MPGREMEKAKIIRMLKYLAQRQIFTFPGPAIL